MFVFSGAEAKISLETDLCGHYRGNLCHWEVDLVGALFPPVSEKHVQELIGLLSSEGGNVGSSRPAFPSRPVVAVISPVHFLASAYANIPVVVQAGKGTTPIWKKKRSLRVVLSSDEKTESDDVGLRPRKMHNTVFVP